MRSYVRFALFLILAGVFIGAAGSTLAGMDARMLRHPDVSADRIAFVYAGDIWVVAKSGGTAQRLSTPAGEESFPRFSPDGSRLAFSGNYDGNEDIYVMAVDGGLPERLTHHPAGDRILDWYPDGGSLLYASSMASGTNRFNQFYRLPAAGGLPQKLPVPYGEFGRVSADGTTLAYTLRTRDFRTWKRYRGGMAPDIWLFDLVSFEARNITDHNANDSLPMWHGSTLYFLSDRDDNMRANIWAVDTKGGTPRQVTTFADLDVAFPSIGPDEIVFSSGSDLYLLDLKSEKTHKVAVDVVTDRATLKPRIENVAERLSGGDISPSGKRLVLEARGDIFSVPAEHGVTRNLTATTGIAERSPAWSPDGKQIAYFSDRSGEYELTLRAADGSGEERQVSRMGPGFRYDLNWSPDSKKLAFADQAMHINYYDLDRDELTRVDQGLDMFHGTLAGFRVDWSADSRWFAYSRGLEDGNGCIFLYDTAGKALHKVTSGFYSDTSPAFDPEGKYLYFLSGRTFEPIYSDLDNTWIYTNTTNLVAVPLRQDVPSPLAARNDHEKIKGDESDSDSANKDKDDGDKDAKTAGKNGKNGKKNGDEDTKDKAPEPVRIDLDGFERRLVVLPPKNGNYDDLRAVAGKVIYRRQPRTGSSDESSPIVYFDLKEREEKTILDDADGYTLSADGKKMVVTKKQALAIVDVAAGQKMDKPIDLSGLEMEVDPVAEWQQIFNDVWRLQRDYFYDPGMHGVDWVAMGERYGNLLKDAVTRWDVNFVIGELIAELNSSHAYRAGGDTEEEEHRGVGLLGTDFALENGAYRFSHILDGGAWDNEARSPLRQPGINVKEGDYLLAVNGRALDTSRDPWAAFQGLAEKTVVLTINDKPVVEGSREVLVQTLDDDFRLRNLAWIEDNRKRVEEATGGRVGYVYVPSTGRNGQTELVRMFRGQLRKDALIIDERFNSGGQIPDRFVELLNRPLYNYWGVRDGQDWQWPPVSNTGPKVMLVNGWSGSGGDALPFYFREAGLGPLIGTRTWGGLIGISGAPRLIDGGRVTVPTFGMYSTAGEWIIEGHGVDPDIEVVDNPALMARGGDPQLERAIQEILRRLQELPPAAPGRPAYPFRAVR